MRYIVAILLSSYFFISTAEVPNKVKELVKSYPSSYSTTSKLAQQINSDFTTPNDKAAAIYFWISNNIKYDVKAFLNNKVKSQSFSYSSEEEKEQKIKALQQKLAHTTLKKKRAVCEGYSTLFYQLCQLTDIECEIISGSSKTGTNQIGKLPKYPDHAWNAIKLNKQWHLIDVTWGAGYVDFEKEKFIPRYTESYFLMTPDLFFLNHFPTDKKWLLIDKTEQDFADLPLHYLNSMTNEINIQKPLNGIIEIPKDKKIHFEFRTNKKGFSYAFSNDKSGTILKAQPINGLLKFVIQAPKRPGNFLTIYYQNSAFVSYKIVR